MKNKIFLLFLLFCGCAGTENARKIASLETLANQADSLRQYQQSIEIYSDIITLDPRNYRAYTNRGRALLFDGKSVKAMADFNKAVALHPGVATWMPRAVAFQYLQDYPGAAPDLHRILSANPKMAEAAYQLTFIMLSLGKLDSAQFYCTRAENDGYQKGYSFSAWFGIYMYKGDYEAAEAEMSKAITYFPTEGVWYNNRAFARNYLGKYQQAVTDCESCIHMFPDFAYAYNNKGLALLYLNNADSALFFINRSLQLKRGNAYAYKNRGQVFLAMNRTGDACNDFATGASLTKDSLLSREIRKLRFPLCQ